MNKYLHKFKKKLFLYSQNILGVIKCLFNFGFVMPTARFELARSLQAPELETGSFDRSDISAHNSLFISSGISIYFFNFYVNTILNYL